MPHIGVDLGGAKLASAIFTADGDILHRESVQLDGRGGSEVGTLIAEHIRVLLERIRGVAADWGQPIRPHVALAASMLGGDAGLYGAGRLAFMEDSS